MKKRLLSLIQSTVPCSPWNSYWIQGFTLIELLIVITIISILTSMLLPVLGTAKSSAKNTQCINLLKQIGTAEMMYAFDFNDYVTPPQYKKYSPSVDQQILWISLLWGYMLPGDLNLSPGQFAPFAGDILTKYSRKQGGYPFWGCSEYEKDPTKWVWWSLAYGINTEPFSPPKSRFINGGYDSNFRTMDSDFPSQLELARVSSIQKTAERVFFGECQGSYRNFYHPSAMDGLVPSINSKIWYSSVTRHRLKANYFFWDSHISSISWNEAYFYYSPDNFLN